MKKNFILLLCLVILSLNAHAQAPVEWQKLFGGAGTDGFDDYNIKQTTDGGYILSGTSSSFSSNSGTLTGFINMGGDDGWIIKVDASGNTSWQKLLGGANDDGLYSVQQTTDGGYIVAGISGSSNTGTLAGINNNGGIDGWILKLDAAGNTLWQKLLGGANNDYIFSIRETPDGGFIATGQANSSNSGTLTGINNNGGPFDGWVIRLDASGNTIWQKLLGGDNDDALRESKQTSDGGYIVVGFSNSGSGSGTLAGLTNHGGHDGWILKLDAAGNTSWQKLLGGNDEEYFNSVDQATDGGYITALASRSSNTGTFAGITSNGGYDGWIVKFDAIGNTSWQKLLGGSGDDYFYGCRQNSMGNYIVVGYSMSSNTGTLAGITNHGNNDAWLLELNASGVTQWQELIGGNDHDYLYSIQPTSDGGYIAEGASSSSNNGTLTGVSGNGFQDAWLVKIAAGVLPVTLGDFTAKKINENKIQLDWFTFSENNNSGFYVERSLDNTTSFSSIGFIAAKGTNGNSNQKLDYTFTDNNNHKGINYYRLKQVDRDGKFIYSKILGINFNDKLSVQVFPNPVTDHVTINFEGLASGQYQVDMTALNGTVLSSTRYSISTGMQQADLLLSKYPAGTYLITITDISGNIFLKKKIIKQ
ncbi:MAG: T9SS type A sorting domain-containing protein [Ferruginibacter sp.]